LGHHDVLVLHRVMLADPELREAQLLGADDQLQVLVVALTQRFGRVVERHDEHAVADRLHPVAHARSPLMAPPGRRLKLPAPPAARNGNPPIWTASASAVLWFSFERGRGTKAVLKPRTPNAHPGPRSPASVERLRVLDVPDPHEIPDERRRQPLAVG